MATLPELGKALKIPTTKNIFLVHGADVFLVGRAVLRITEYVEKNGRAEVEKYDGKKPDFAQIYNAVLTPSFFHTTARVFILEDPEPEKLTPNQLKDLETILTSVRGENYLIVVFKENTFEPKKSARCKTLQTVVDKIGVVVALAAPSQQDTLRFVRDLVSEKGGTITDAALRLLVAYYAEDLTRLGVETGKLLNYHTEITKETVEALCTPSAEVPSPARCR